MILLKASLWTENRAVVLEELAQLRQAALGTAGCRGFEVIEDAFEPRSLTVVEEWADAESLEAHDAGEAVAAFQERTIELVEHRGPTQVFGLARRDAVFGESTTGVTQG